MELIEFPTTLPTGKGLEILTAALRGQPVDKWVAIRVAGHTILYVLGQMQGQPVPVGPLVLGAAPEMSREECAACLEALPEKPKAGAVAAMKLPWGKLLQTLLPLILELLSKSGE